MKSLTLLYLIVSWAHADFDPVNDVKGIALNTYDVVAYFQNNKNKINNGTKGLAKFSSDYKNTKYYFSSQKNKEIFDLNPEKYLPAYGGWCAWAVAQGDPQVKVDYDTFLIKKDASGEDKLYLFYNSWGVNTLKKWNKTKSGSHDELVNKADAIWANAIKGVQ